MCRMIGIISKKPISSFWMENFRELSVGGKVLPGMMPGHTDGWGVGCYINGKAKYLGREPKNAAQWESGYRFIYGKIELEKPTLLIAHIRKASRGSKSIDNTHPFKKRNWLFCHNGTILDCENIPLSAELEGETDSEQFFRFLLEKIGGEKVVDIVGGLKAAIEYIWKTCQYTSLTFLLSNGQFLFAYRDFNENYQGGDYTSEELKAYYTLKYSWGRDFFAVCSEELSPGNLYWEGITVLKWHDMRNKELIGVDKNLHVVVEAIFRKEKGLRCPR